MDERGRRPNEALAASPFARLARTHALSIAGDTLVTLALADSIFFGISPSESRPKVLLYLVVTMAPFAVIAPLLGPWIDSTQGGRKLMIVAAALARAFVAVLLVDDVDGLLLFPEAFAVLVFAKAHQVARSALVPVLVHGEDELVEANSKLAVISGVVGFAVGVPGALLVRVAGAPWVLAAAAIAFAASGVLALRLPPAAVATGPVGDLERAELRSRGVLLAASAMGALRGIVGFLTFHVAFYLRSDDAPAWWFGIVIAVSAAGAMTGAAVAPRLRRLAPEARILTGALGAIAAAGLLATTWGGRGGGVVLAAVVAVGSSAAKTAFDAIVQRDAPDANQGRSFAQFETRFQLVWVVGALAPVVVSMPDRLGYAVVAGTAAFAASSYAIGRRGSTPTTP